ncbi:hypothetical protein LY56_02528 [Roseinatronobacter thiooxidans]|uniref:O-antigen ligase-like membrane protein n=1 Tax=Roseinatronobacter thiooxidans TaxID=121821 RepID=A0A2W7QQK5_9RHOB|nr:hypothetical protein [Roseinatronobacter thiooxidans]PZX40645.1 hypothetical protein LY56_02528 [Roseinatronobacter thiooxidans]
MYKQYSFSRNCKFIAEVFAWLALGALTVVVPNTLKVLMATVLVVLFLIYMIRGRVICNGSLLLYYFAGCFVTVFYLLVGVINGAPAEAIPQIILVYVISPLLWIVVISKGLDRFGLESIVNGLLILGVFAVASQAFFVWAFMNQTFLPVIEAMSVEPNVHYSDGYFGVSMHVFGSLIFISGGFFSSTYIISRFFLRYLFLFTLLISAFTSGRSALILVVVIGIFMGILFSSRRLRDFLVRGAISLMAILLIFYIVGWILFHFFDIDIAISINRLIFKLEYSGGDVRADYVPLLWDGFLNGALLGAGHGIGVEIVVSQFPWRYEVVPLATLFRVGLIGSILYAIPFVMTVFYIFMTHLKSGLSKYERFLAGGLISALIAATTNPYIEGVVFQWMYILPVVYFFKAYFRERKQGQC